MKKISTADIQEGMVLARDVNDATGRVLLGSGTKLNLQHKNILIRRDVATIMIAEDKVETGQLAAAAAAEKAGEAEESPEAKARIERVQFMFSDVAADAIMGELMKLALAKAKAKPAGGPAGG